MRESIHLQEVPKFFPEISRARSLCEAICIGLRFLDTHLRADGLTIGRKTINGIEIDCYRTLELTHSGVVKDPDSDTWIVSRSIRLARFKPLTISALFHLETTREEDLILSRVCEDIGIASQRLPATSDQSGMRNLPLTRSESNTLPFQVVKKTTSEQDIANLLRLKAHEIGADRQVVLPITAGME